MKSLKSLLSLFAIGLFTVQSVAKEGMWIPSMLTAVYNDMHDAGLQLTEEQLYDVNKSSLKDAIVIFGGGCTGEVVSKEGLLLTNHHCGFDYIQFHSSLQNDYLKDGFWAMNRNQELICEGLSVVFIVRMDDVTEKMRAGIKNGMAMNEIDLLLSKNKRAVEEDIKKGNAGMGVQIRAFNYGNQYFAIVTKSYNDVRLVGAPPTSIGKFGGDTDNWVWPRHTGDFSMFRIYADKNNQPATYSKDNVPYKAAHFLPVNIGGAKEGDFSMVYGFPGRTEHLLTSYAVDFVMNQSNPMRISYRDQTIGVLEARMRTSDEIRIKYAAKQSDVANAWKKWKGQQMGLINFRAVEQKRKFEEEFTAKTKLKEYAEYAEILPKLKGNYIMLNPYMMQAQKFQEYVYYGPEMFNFAYKFNSLLAEYDSLVARGDLQKTIDALKKDARLFYKDFDLETEKQIYSKLEPLYHQRPASMIYADAVYNVCIFKDSTELFKYLDKFNKKALKKMRGDYFYVSSVQMFDQYNNSIKPKLIEYQKQVDYYMQQYTAAMMVMFPGNYWSDANSTLRISYGKVEGSEPRDGEIYKYFTTADGILDKYYTQNPDFEINPKLKSLLEMKDYGIYGENGELHVCYTGSNHTTGGNSGSPALNGKGELTGINFDRSWESTMSDITYNPDICRNIMVDIRYVLWVVDVYAGAGYLVEEMKIVR